MFQFPVISERIRESREGDALGLQVCETAITQVNLLEIDPATIFKDAKTVAGELQKALNVLARTPAK